MIHKQEDNPLLAALNAEQREAVLENEQPLLILAGAGSGKTRVITTKIAYLVRDLGCDPHSILAVTFTNKAAREMKERVAGMVPKAQDVMVKTFHSFGAWLLRQYASRIGLSDHFTIYDQDDSITLLHSIYPNYKRRELKPVADWISRAKDHCLTPRDDVSSISRDSRFPEMYAAYETRIREIGNVDFGDLIVRPVELLQEHPDIRRRVRARFRVILVDEYQDSNVAQYKLLQELFEEGSFLCVVGDDDQSIYRFRGAELRNILSFPDNFPNTRVIKLEQNYRSTGNILSIATEVVQYNSGRHGKVLRTDKSYGTKAALSFFDDQFAEAQFCAELVSSDHRYDETAILYRTNAQSAAFETVFMRLNIPYKVVGALRFYDREEVKDALALLALCLNPADEISFRRIVNKPVRGIGPASLELIMEGSRGAFGDCLQGMKSAAETRLKGKARTGAVEFLTCYEAAIERLGKSDLSQFVQQTLHEFGIVEFHRRQDEIASTQKVSNLEELVNAVSVYPPGREGLSHFMETLELDHTTLGRKDPSDQPGVTLITMHNTKGLEFDRVIITGLEEGLFPSGINESDDDIEEERRIFYVSITRARQELFFTSCRRRTIWGQTRYQMPSRFLRELPPEHVDIRGRVPYEFSSFSPDGALPRETGNPLDQSQAHWYKKEATPSAGMFAAGDRVYHDSYGPGSVVSSVTENGRELVTVWFETGRTMKFIPQYAPLEKIAQD
ncbi:MAG: ATP-dependent helicase [Spirochaetota bacterium]